jgi:hypothetical protein
MLRSSRIPTMQKKFAAYLIASLVVATVHAAQQAPQNWVTYTPPTGRFTAQFPAAPTPDHAAMNDGGLIVTVDTYIASSNGMFFINDMRVNPKATPTADAALKSAEDGMLQTGGAKLLTSSMTNYVRGPNDQLPMLEFTGGTNSTAVSGRAIFDTDHIYTLATLCPKTQDCSAASQKFFNAFKLKPKK